MALYILNYAMVKRFRFCWYMYCKHTHTHLSIPTIHCFKGTGTTYSTICALQKPNNNMHNPEFEFHLWQTTHQTFLCHWFLSTTSLTTCAFMCFLVSEFLLFLVFFVPACSSQPFCFHFFPSCFPLFTVSMWFYLFLFTLSLIFFICSQWLTFLFAPSDSRIMANQGVDNQSSGTGGKTDPESNIDTNGRKWHENYCVQLKLWKKLKRDYESRSQTTTNGEDK